MDPTKTGKVRQTDMTEGSILKALLVFSLPLIAGTFFQMLYTTVDTVIVGRYVGTEALSALGGSAAQIVNIFVGLFVGISTGSSVIAAQAYGGKAVGQLKRTVHTAAAFAVVFGVVLTAITFILAAPMLRLMRTPDDSFSHSFIYMRTLAIGMIPNMVYNTGAGILRAVGDSKRPFQYLIVGTVVNIILDYLFVAKFGMGVFGAAFATSIAQIITAILIVLSLLRTKDVYRLEPKEIRIDRATLRQILHVGIPSAIQSMMYSLSNAFIMSYINTFGTVTVAAWGVTGKLDAIFWMIINSLGISITTFTGQNYGAGKKSRIYKGVRESFVMCFAVSILFGIILYYFSPVLVPIFTRDSRVIREGVMIEQYFAKIYFLYICIEVFSAVLRGMGDVVVPTIISVLGVCVFRILWIVVMMPKSPSIITISRGYPVSWAIASIAFVGYFIYRESRGKKEV